MRARAAARRPRAAASAGDASRGEMLPTHRLPRSAERAPAPLATLHVRPDAADAYYRSVEPLYACMPLKEMNVLWGNR